MERNWHFECIGFVKTGSPNYIELDELTTYTGALFHGLPVNWKIYNLENLLAGRFKKESIFIVVPVIPRERISSGFNEIKKRCFLGRVEHG